MFGAEPGGDAAFLPAEAARGGSTELSRSDFKPNFMVFFSITPTKCLANVTPPADCCDDFAPSHAASCLFMSLFIIIQSKSNFVNESLNGLSDFMNSGESEKSRGKVVCHSATIGDRFAKLEGELSSLLAGESLACLREAERQLITLLRTIQRRFCKIADREVCSDWLRKKKNKKKITKLFPIL